MPADDLPAPAVPAERYTEAYYRAGCMGAALWDGGAGLDPLYGGYARAARIRPGDVVVDLGCGRGELLVAVLEAGAGRAIGVEYAPAAMKLAAQTLDRHGAGDRAELHLADARALPLPGAIADVVCLLDVVEHLTPPELQRALEEARRVLKPGGRLLVHTLPNRLVYDVTYRLHRLLAHGGARGWPADPRTPEEQAMHVNEMTLGSLRRALRSAGFANARASLGAMIHAAFVPDEDARVLYHRLAAHRPTARFGRADLWAHATR